MTLDAAATSILALKKLTDSVRGLRTLRLEHEVEVVRADLLEKVIDAKRAGQDLRDENAAIKQQLRDAKQHITALRQHIAALQDELTHLRSWDETEIK